MDSQTPVSTRANIYKILADLFKIPQPSFQAFLTFLSEELEGYAEQCREAGKGLQEHFSHAPEALQALQVEHARLFIGPYHVLVPPYSSLYLDEPPQIMGPSTQKAIEYYIQADLNPHENNKEPPDHISTELEFMYFLLFQYVKTGEASYPQLAASFLKEHLGQWSPLLADRILETTQHPFYQGLTRFLLHFMKEEQSEE